MSQQQQQKECFYCKIKLSRVIRNDEDTRWISFNLDGSEHTYQQCKAIQKNKNQQLPLQQQQGQQYFPVKKEATVTTVTLDSLYARSIFHDKEIRELRKMVETVQSVIDSIYQQNVLILDKIGYRGPETTSNVKKEDENEKDLKPNSVGMDWKVISEEFQCHGCGGKKHNGWKKYDAKICDDCYDEMNKITDVTSSKNDLPESETINAIDYHVQRDEQEIKGNDDII